MNSLEAIVYCEQNRPAMRFNLRNFEKYMDLDDLIQEVYIHLLKKDRQIDQPIRYTWMIARNIVWTRRHLGIEQIIFDALPDIPSTAPTPDDEIYWDQLTNQLYEILSRWSPRKRRIYEMWAFEGYFYHEIAKQFQITESGVKQHLHHAKQDIRNANFGTRAGLCPVPVRRGRPRKSSGGARQGAARAKSAAHHSPTA